MDCHYHITPKSLPSLNPPSYKSCIHRWMLHYVIINRNIVDFLYIMIVTIDYIKQTSIMHRVPIVLFARSIVFRQ